MDEGSTFLAELRERMQIEIVMDSWMGMIPSSTENQRIRVEFDRDDHERGNED